MNNLDSEPDVVGLNEKEMEKMGKIISRGPLQYVSKQEREAAKKSESIMAGNAEAVTFSFLSSPEAGESGRAVSSFVARLRESVRAEEAVAAAERDGMSIAIRPIGTDCEGAEEDGPIEVRDGKRKKKSSTPLVQKSLNEEKGAWHWTRPGMSEEEVRECHEGSERAEERAEAPGLPTVGMGPSDSTLRIRAETLVAMLSGDIRQEYVLVDCRFEHEYSGGHIVTAASIMSVQGIATLFRKHVAEKTASSTAFIFYCEYSSVRAPRLAACMRNEDRRHSVYPSLLFPNVYVLEGGYKQFFRNYPDFCVPRAYVPMEP